MSKFGRLLNRYRRNCVDPQRGGHLTQGRLGELIGDQLDDMGYTAAAISNWETGRSQPSHNERTTLVALIQALYQCGGCATLREANALLAAGNYLTLTEDEVVAVTPLWVDLIHVEQQLEVVEHTARVKKNWARLARYLPSRLFQEISLSAREQWEPICLAHLRRLLQVVLTYIPRHLAIDLLETPLTVAEQRSGHFLEGTLLFADISGFTQLTERLRVMGGKEGAEEILHIINDYLDVMLGILFQYNGRLIKFGGDAMLCLFTGEDGAIAAVQTAWEMGVTMREQFAQVEAFREIFPLGMKVGQNSGLLFAATVGSSEHIEYILTGSAVENTARAEAAAQRDEIIISEETYNLVQDHIDAERLADLPSYFRVIAIHADVQFSHQNLWQAIEQKLTTYADDIWGIVERLDALTPYLPHSLLAQLVYNPRETHLEGQHRQVTVLFVNFVGMTEVIARCGVDDEEQIGNVLHEYFSTMQEEAHYYGGVTNKVDLYDQGDKLMIIFGAPTAHERDTRRAALTALAMQQAMGRLSAPLANAFLSQRIGIHTGFVFAGNVGSEQHNRREYTVMGDTVNLAARLMSAANHGETWISESVYKQLSAEFETERLDPLTLKGIDKPVTAYRLRGTKTAVELGRPIRAFNSPLVGRESELEKLSLLLDDLLFGAGKQMVAVIGEGGVGKSRLLLEWQTRAQGIGESETAVKWIQSHGVSFGQRTNGILIGVLEGILDITPKHTQLDRWQILSRYLRESLSDQQEEWVTQFMKRMAYLGYLMDLDLTLKQGMSERISQLDEKSLQLQIHLTLLDVLIYAAKQQPLILILEDLHWADEASLELLRFLIDQLDDNISILFCFVFRQQNNEKIWQVWQDMHNEYPDYCQTIMLNELEPSDGYQILHNLLQTKQRLDPALLSLIHKETDGNPLYMEEVLHCLIEDGVLRQEEHVWHIQQQVDRIYVPDTLHQIIQSRIDALDFGSPGARRVLWLAAVLGTEFTTNALRHLFEQSGRDREEFQQHIRQLRNSAMLKRVRIQVGDSYEPGFCFRHGLVQQVAYENMPTRHRRLYHEQVGQWLEHRYPEMRQAYYDILADHFEKGQVWSKAFHYHWLAGKRDAKTYANSSARHHLQTALRLVPSLDIEPELVGDVYFAHGRLLSVMGEYEPAREEFEQADQHWSSLEDEAVILKRARLCYELGRTYEQVGGQDNWQTALEIHERGLKLLETHQLYIYSEKAMLHALGAIAHIRLTHLDEAEVECHKGLQTAEKTGDKWIIGFVHRLLSVSARHHGQAEQAMTHIAQAIAINEEIGDLIGLGKDYSNQGVFAFEIDDWPTTRLAYTRAIELLARTGDRFQQAMTFCNLADLYFHQGDLINGLAAAEQGLALFEQQQSYQGVVFAHTVMGTLLWKQQTYEASLEQLLAAQAMVDAQGIKEFRPIVDRWLAEVYLAQGQPDRAWVFVNRWREQPEDVLDLEFEPFQHLYGRLLAAEEKKTQAVSVIQASIGRLKAEGDNSFLLGRAHLSLAKILGDQEKMRAAAQEALRIFTVLGARLDAMEASTMLS